jgi:trans-aconitate methyltransferase
MTDNRSMSESDSAPRPSNDWRPDVYARHAAFVPALAADLVDLLAPRAGERILDLGCGDGVLTSAIADRGAVVVGVDASPEMLSAAAARGLDVRRGEAERLPFDHEFDAVFSNAMLHWTQDIDAVLSGVARALRPGGRFVGEFGGPGNTANILRAASRVLVRRGLTFANPWYFPASDAFGRALTHHGFTIDVLTVFPRPTPLPTGMAGWLEMFGGPMFTDVPIGDRVDVVHEMEAELASTNRRADGVWITDYVRLRFMARLGVAATTESQP